jgi:hypothetical protein
MTSSNSLPRADETPLTRRFGLSTLRAAWWALRALRRGRRALRTRGLEARIDAPPPLPWGARRGVYAVLRRKDPTCLERALVLQRWLAAHGRPHDVVVGVARREGSVTAHAWLDFESESSGHDFGELLRLPPG